MEPHDIRTMLDEVLPTVQSPSRYLGLERNLTRKPWDSVELRVALAFPDAYEIGMSHQGTRILYHLVNRRDDALAERTFAPMPDMADALRTAGLPLYTLESYHAVSDFDVVGISLQSELNYINVPYLLDLAGITRRADARGRGEPLVISGGPCTANPEPVADFFDAILIGDAEAALDAMLDAIRDGRAAGEDRRDILKRLAGIEGVYVPSFYTWRPASGDDPGGWVEPDGVPFPVKRVWVDELDLADQPEAPIVPFAGVIQDRLGLEVMRGCTQGCRFCQAGYWYRPVREHDPAQVVERLERQVDETGFEEVGLLSLSTADYSQVEPLVYNLAERLSDRRVSVNLPSLRADAFSVGLAEAVSRVRKSGFTFAPETGSDRLRRVINKTFTNADMVQAAEAAFSKGWNSIKVYAMIGLPTETDEDLEELAILAEDLVKTGRRIRGRKVQIKVSVGCFIPKAWTPFQWQPFVRAEEQQRRIWVLKDRFRRIKGARLTWSDPEEATLEALLSRGGRELSRTIERAHDLGAVFDGWNDYLDLDAWRRAVDETGIDLDRELGERPIDRPLPWDIIDAGVRKGYLKAEWRRAVREAETEDCKWGRCYRCGIPGDGADTKLAACSMPLLGEALPEAQQPKAAAYKLRPAPRVPPPAQLDTQPPVHRRYRFTFTKMGDARHLSHRQVMDALERAMRGGRVPVRYTEGYNPHIRLSMGPALGVGQEGEAELFDMDCTSQVRQQHLTAVNRLLPEGIEVIDAKPLLQGAPSLGKMVSAARYRIAPRPGLAWPESQSGLDGSVADAVLRWTVLSDGSLSLDLNARQTAGPTTSVKQVLAGLGLSESEVQRARIRRERLVLRAPGTPRASRAAGSTTHS
ncbi:MAG: TIGR03960 family B12-binding radical SAM protein [Candidatus Sulfomarinibacteraceae bacterium]